MFRALYNPLCNFAYKHLGSRDEAEETVQSVFINLWEKRADVAIDTSVKSYLYRSVRNHCLNVLKHEKVKREYATYAKQSVATSQSESTFHETGELENRIADALLKLPEQCRIIFSMSRFEELKYGEIAAQLGLSIKTVENQMGKALRIMREELRDYLPLLILLNLTQLIF